MNGRRAKKVLKFLDAAMKSVMKASVAAGPEVEEYARMHIFIGNAVEDLTAAKQEIAPQAQKEERS